MEFKDQVILITGATGGFGCCLAEKLSAQGAKLILTDLDQGALDTLAASLKGEFKTLAGDVRSEAHAQATVKLAVDTYGQLNIAINNAGVASPVKSFVETTEEDMDISYSVNAKGVFFGMKHQLLAMTSQSAGTILNISSVAGLGAAPSLAAYSAAKHAVVGLTKTAAAEFARMNIRVNAICPFFSPTPMVTNSVPPNVVEALPKRTPIGRLGEPEEMVEAMLSIIRPSNRYMTGQAIAVDGGFTAV